MSRALTSQRSVITVPDRDRFVERSRARRMHYERAGCRYWLFEEVDLAGAFLECIEGPDAPTLEAALAAAPDRFLDQTRIYVEVVLT